MRKILFYTAFVLIVIVVETFNWIGFLMDEILFPSYRKKEIDSSLFIIGMPRSATTLLFNTLNEDSDRFTSMKLWEILFAPSVIQKKIINLLSRLDKKLNCFLSNRLRKWESRIFSPYEEIHPLSLFNNEEDDYVLMHALSSAILVFIFPGVKKYRSLIRFDTEISPKRKKRILSFYNRCIQKHMFVFGNNKIYLSKSPSHTPRLQSLCDTFNNCKLVYLMRIPEQTISSAINMYHVYRKTFHTAVHSEEVIKEALDTADHWYHYPVTKIESWQNGSSQIVKFEELTSDPEKVITALYAKFGFEISAVFGERLSECSRNSTVYKSRHNHSLQRYGLSIEEIRARYISVYERYFPAVLSTVKH